MSRVQPPCRSYSAESRLLKLLLLASPVAVVATVPIINRYLLTFLYLQPPVAEWDLAAAFRSKVSLAAASAFPVFLAVWWGGLKLQPWFDRQRFPWAAALALIVIVGCCAVFQNPRLTWFFVEWVIPRTPNPSFARNTLFWEQRNFESDGPKAAVRNIGLVGSSQTYQGFDLERLKAKCTKDRFEKNCLAGFGPMQYPFLLHRIEERGFDLIVCQMSEFDFCREDEIPVSRLRWGAAPNGIVDLSTSLTPLEQWNNRGELADLAFASVVPLWRQRDHIRRAALDYWWKRSNPPAHAADGEVVLADAPSLTEAIEHLKRNVGDKKLVEANFRSFATFARALQARKIRLVVLEGHVHPDARRAYDQSSMQATTRQRLSAMATEFTFQFQDVTDQPSFDAADFADAYHLNSSGRAKLSDYTASFLATLQ